MKKMKFTTLLLSVLMVMGCSTNAGTGSLLGAGGGAALGAAIGQLIGKDTKGTVIGAAIGTAVGATAGTLIGKHMDKVKAQAAAVENAKVEEFTDANGLQGVKMTFDGGILFDTGKANLSASAKKALADFAVKLKAEPLLLVDIQGHTDNTGSLATNQKLSQSRAQSVANYLMQNGVPASQFQSVAGYDYQYPVADNSTAAGRQQNRRVEVYLYASQAMIDAATNGTLQ